VVLWILERDKGNETDRNKETLSERGIGNCRQKGRQADRQMDRQRGIEIIERKTERDASCREEDRER
jgi:hypothetical protein